MASAVNEVIKGMAIQGIKQGGKALVDAVCKELSTDQLTSMAETIKNELNRRASEAKPV